MHEHRPRNLSIEIPADLQCITDDQGRQTAIILAPDAYTELLEDLSDLAIAVERRDESLVSHKDLLDSLKDHASCSIQVSHFTMPREPKQVLPPLSYSDEPKCSASPSPS